MPTPISVALVDDYPPLRSFLRKYLSSEGFIIPFEADNGEDLLQQLNGRTRLPDMCLLNINMPVMDGYETARYLKKFYPSIRILAFSFHDDKKRVDKILDCGAHAFICKDSAPEEVRDALRDLYSRSQRAMHLQAQLLNFKASVRV